MTKLSKETELRSRAEAEVTRLSKLMSNVTKLTEKKEDRANREDKERRENGNIYKTPRKRKRTGKRT